MAEPAIDVSDAGRSPHKAGWPAPPAACDGGPSHCHHVEHETRAIVLAGLCSGLLYFLVYQSQHGIFLNGLDPVAAWYRATSLADPPAGAIADRGRLIGQCFVYYAGISALYVLYNHVLTRCRQGRPRDRRARVALVLFPLLFAFGLLCGRPTLSQDALTYVAYGYVAATSGGNPQAQWASDVLPSPIGAQLLALGWHPLYFSTPYGPVWTAVESGVMHLTGEVAVALVLFKALAIAACLGAAGAIWLILRQIRPADQLAGTISFLWNPIVIIQFAAEGHNDALMIVLVLAAILWGLRGHPWASIGLLGLGILTKYVPLLLLPGLLVYLWRTRRLSARHLWVATGLALAAGVAIALYRPAWVGAATFAGLRARLTPGVSASIPGLLTRVLAHALPSDRAALVASALLGGAFCAYLAGRYWHVRNAEIWLSACGSAVLFGVLVASPVYWPWYAALPIALLALTPSGPTRRVSLALSLGAALIAPLDALYVNHFITWHVDAFATIALGLAMPLLFWLAASWPGLGAALRLRSAHGGGA